MNWEDILKNIQISSQKTSSRDYVLPDEDEEVPDVEQEEEDCSQWWIDLMDMCDNFLENWGGNKYRRSGFRGPIDDFTNDELCQKKQEIINSTPNIINRYSNYKDRTFDKAVIRFGKIDSAFIRFICNSNERNLEVPTLEINIAINNKHIYHKVVNIDYTNRPGKPSDIGGHIGHTYQFPVFLLRCIRIFKDWKGSQNLEKATIQIGSQKTSSRDYVKPDEDDEDCFKWWLGLFAIIDRLILAVNKNYTLRERSFGNLTNEYLCQKKEEIINQPVKFYSAVVGYLKYGGPPEGRDVGLSIAIEDYAPQLFVGVRLSDVLLYFYSDEIPIQLEENTADVKTYTNAAVFEVVKKFHVAELDLMQYVNIDGDPRMTAKLVEIYDDYLREKFDVKKNIQISGQRTSSRDYVKPNDDDEDCREWWRELHRIYNKMISAIDRNATLVIDNKVEVADNKALCELRDAILNTDVYKDTAGTYGRNFKYTKELVEEGGIGIYGQMLDTKPGPYSGPFSTRLTDRINFFSYYDSIFNQKPLFDASVSIWNDSIVYELDRIKEKTGEGKLYAYSVVEPFLEAELELKKHIGDPNPAPFIATKIIAIYEKYLNSDVKKSINIGSQKTSGRNYVKPDEPDCREKVLEIADRIMKFSYSDEFDMDNPVRENKYSKFYLNGYYQGMPSDEINESDRLSLESYFIENIDEETCCLILETIDKYKGQNLVEVEVPAPNADGAEKGAFVYTKEIFRESCFIQIFFSSGKHIAATLSVKLDLKNGIPPSIITEIEDIFESR